MICDRMVMPCQHNHGVQYIHSCIEEWSCKDTTHKKHDVWDGVKSTIISVGNERGISAGMFSVSLLLLANRVRDLDVLTFF